MLNRPISGRATSPRAGEDTGSTTESAARASTTSTSWIPFKGRLRVYHAPGDTVRDTPIARWFHDHSVTTFFQPAHMRERSPVEFCVRSPSARDDAVAIVCTCRLRYAYDRSKFTFGLFRSAVFWVVLPFGVEKLFNKANLYARIVVIPRAHDCSGSAYERPRVVVVVPATGTACTRDVIFASSSRRWHLTRRESF